ncbi:PP2C family protein-serine/threonine phosphatase [Xanthomonas translucens]|uniref:PP2C family protein-serine/threonine phosphatase n=1 Tax=Xanthomonas campestris pv. translucens TaxID=343 RepID=UPI000D20C59C|nr:PP2C family serine/threonine-protein phosphatase [Xanthomonas translucens]AVY67429.1 phosphoprotein phosphatase [Xanthomonas translucens pv. undulosa]
MSAGYVCAGRTAAGNVRRQNQDAILLREDVGLWAVADGLGGHSAGEVASHMVIERLGALPRRGGVVDFVEGIDAALGEVNAELRALARRRSVDVIGSTVVMLLHDADLLLCGWVGDSRAYLFESGVLHPLTRDHVVGCDDGAARSGRHAPASGVLTRAIGADDLLCVDWMVLQRRPGQCVLLCSDGINKELDDTEIAAHCRRAADPHTLVARLFDSALARAGRDNVSAIVLRLDDAASP